MDAAASQPIWLTLTIAAASSSAISAILTHWMGKGRDAEIERLKNSLAEGSYITRTQYDLELGYYKEMWKALSDVSYAANNLLVDNAYGEDGYSLLPKDWRANHSVELKKILSQKHGDLSKAIRGTAPFIPSDIWEASRKALNRTANIISFLMQTTGNDPMTTEWAAQYIAHFKPLLEDNDRVRDLIRSRLKAVSVK